jgi:DNA-binding response OmpR family regulator
MSVAFFGATHLRVLLVEDDVLLAFPIEHTLLDAGHQVEVVHSSNDALNALHRETTQFDALVTDIRLGPGPDGWEVARRARKLNEAIRVIYMTADSAASWVGNGVPRSAMLRKPYALTELTRFLD